MTDAGRLMQACNSGCGYQFYEGFERCAHRRTREQSYHMLSPDALVGIQNDARLKAVWARQVALAGTPFEERPPVASPLDLLRAIRADASAYQWHRAIDEVLKAL